MKKTLMLIFLLLILFGVRSFAQADSVKVRLQTSNGAEVSLDGDLSSTNIIIKKVPFGKHEVIVKYGNYSRAYQIDLSQGGKTEFEFFVDGNLSLGSTPSDAEVMIDGLPMGKTPLELNLLGRHNIQVLGNKDQYYPYNRTLEILPEQVVEHNAILQKRPPKLYGFVLANYMVTANAPGIMAGLGRRFGGYIKVNVGINGTPENHDFYTYNQQLSSERYKKKPKYSGINAGLMVHALPQLFAYIGSGYGGYSQGVYDEEYDVYCVDGSELDFGIMFKHKALLLQAGYKRILTKGQTGNFGDFNLGVGITIHKEKKR